MRQKKIEKIFAWRSGPAGQLLILTRECIRSIDRDPTVVAKLTVIINIYIKFTLLKIIYEIDYF